MAELEVDVLPEGFFFAENISLEGILIIPKPLWPPRVADTSWAKLKDQNTHHQGKNSGHRGVRSFM
jgi:hypothetical protein